MPSDSVSLPEPALTPPAVDPVEQLYRELEASVREYRPKDDLSLLEKAYRFASKYHEGQTRDSGEPYMAHPVMVAHILAGMRMDLVAMQTGLLHDVVEDTSVTVEQVRKEFGEEVARCVDGVTKLTKLDGISAEDRHAESFRKMLLAMVEDIRVIMVKLADRMHNMRTLGYLSAERRERIARETLEIYAPIAHRLGMGKVRGELEDLAFQHLEPDACAEILEAIESRRAANEEFLHGDPPHGRGGSAAREHSGAHRRPSQAPVLGLSEAEAAEDFDRSGLRSDGAAHHHRFGEELLRGAGRDPQQVASDTRADQGLHRHPAAQSLPVAAYQRGDAARADVRSPDPHRGDASHRRGRHRRALEVQRGPQGTGGGRSAHRLAAPAGGMAARGAAIRASSCPR